MYTGINKYAETWRALENLYKTGMIKAIGVCNFNISHLQDLLKSARVTPVINQVQFHPRLQQVDLRAFCTECNIRLEAWAPLMQGGLLEDHSIAKIEGNMGN
ncbi:aldo/keto reductase [Solibacillus sp. R5-41]|uniref:aldo/keto reductase n=1 Tax=Solibacillus sp. R5-41 TaxID=2048654 RepID=UPI0020A3715B|nr:aldo/keto reductase [Solibacillus sp. R5-41]